MLRVATVSVCQRHVRLVILLFLIIYIRCIYYCLHHEDGPWSYSLQSCMQQFYENYPDVVVPYKVFSNHRDRIIERFESKHCICKGISTGRPTVLTEQIVDDIRQRIEATPKKSIRKLAAQSGSSFTTARKALVKNLHMHPYRVTVTQQLLPIDIPRRIRYCQWFNENLHNDDILDLTDGYRTQILEVFIKQLHDDKLELGYLQQDGAPPHVAHDTLRYLEEYFGDNLITRDRWPTRTPDVTPFGFDLFGVQICPTLPYWSKENPNFRIITNSQRYKKVNVWVR
ncbi:transposable element tc3 transposase-like protein [Holotrichia oblita]|uniref:Transposable element tc3 transposase-like protein n=1 Tax=Holotrichia oblita TaxID=644536 RepID=A0ACB9SLP2_HOLOL|nr:transposable element tc3 transposase-like protein [Holotrichia oblita]